MVHYSQKSNFANSIATLNSNSFAYLSPNSEVIVNAGSQLAAYGLAFKYGKLVIIYASFSNAYFYIGKNIYTVPEGYRPTMNASGLLRCFRTTSPSVISSTNVIIDANGNIYQGFNGDGTASTWSGMIFAAYCVH